VIKNYSMHIVFEHSARLPVLKYGGTERFLFWLMCELVRKGHRVTYIGDPESKLDEFGIRLAPNFGEDWRKKIPADADLIHLTGTPKLEINFPVIVTIEGNGQENEEFHSNTVFISRKHAANHGGKVFVYNGIPMDRYKHTDNQVDVNDWKDFLFLAKANWKVKNLEGCVYAAKKSHKHLHVAGGRAWAFSRFVSSYGMIDDRKKEELFGKVSALLFPVRWHEPFGIAVIEAMAMGRPVLASPYGSLPELINEDAGVICQNIQELVDNLRDRPRRFSSNQIREWASDKFGIDKTADSYLDLYQKVISGVRLNEKPPKTTNGFIAEELLPF